MFHAELDTTSTSYWIDQADVDVHFDQGTSISSPIGDCHGNDRSQSSTTVHLRDEDLVQLDTDLTSTDCFQWLQDVIFGQTLEEPADTPFGTAGFSRCEDDWKTTFNSGFPLFDDPMLDGLDLPGLSETSNESICHTDSNVRDVASLLEKFEAFEGLARDFQKDCFDCTEIAASNGLTTETQLHRSLIDDSKVSCDLEPVIQPSPPRFSIRLRWKDKDAWRKTRCPDEHDYSSSSSSGCPSDFDNPQSPVAQLLSVDATDDVFAGRQMRSVLKSTTTRSAAKEVLYSKLPDYYTVLAPATLREVEQSCFDKLPSYITGIQGTPAKPITMSDKELPTAGLQGKSIGSRKIEQIAPASRRPAASCVRPKHKIRFASSRSPSCSSRSSSASSSSSSSSASSSYRNDAARIENNSTSSHPSHRHRSKPLEGWQRVAEEVYDDDVDGTKKYIEDRRVVHVGNIAPGTTRCEIRRRFGVFGPIQKITLHRRRHGDCYAFVTFLYKVDAFEALEHGNDDRTLPKYELSLGGRRLFCLENYSDLDAMANRRDARKSLMASALDFDTLLNAAKSQIKSSS